MEDISQDFVIKRCTTFNKVTDKALTGATCSGVLHELRGYRHSNVYRRLYSRGIDYHRIYPREEPVYWGIVYMIQPKKGSRHKSHRWQNVVVHAMTVENIKSTDRYDFD